jgi:hypothetical protein
MVVGVGVLLLVGTGGMYMFMESSSVSKPAKQPVRVRVNEVSRLDDVEGRPENR